MTYEEVLKLFSDLRAVNGALHHRLRFLFEDTPLKGYHTMFLFAIADHRGLTAKELSSVLDVDKGHTSRALNELQAFGYITREAWGRSTAIDLSPKGEELLRRIEVFFGEISTEISDRISHEQWQMFIDVLNVICGCLLEGAPPPRHRRRGEEE